METAYDWLTVFLFAGLVTLFLHRSVDAQRSGDGIWRYLLASVGCAGTNWLGNHGWDLAALALLAATIAFIAYFLRPFSPLPPS
jgi:apolipoprotein N-acyltransferase